MHASDSPYTLLSNDVTGPKRLGVFDGYVTLQHYTDTGVQEVTLTEAELAAMLHRLARTVEALAPAPAPVPNPRTTPREPGATLADKILLWRNLHRPGGL